MIITIHTVIWSVREKHGTLVTISNPASLSGELFRLITNKSHFYMSFLQVEEELAMLKASQL
jgi:hypothetical protein